MSVQKKHSDLFSVPLSEMLLTLSPGDVADEYDDLIKDIDWRLTPPYVCQWAAVPETAKQSLLKDIKASLNRHHIREVPSQWYGRYLKSISNKSTQTGGRGVRSVSRFHCNRATSDFVRSVPRFRLRPPPS